jgi:hypothetical protein
MRRALLSCVPLLALAGAVVALKPSATAQPPANDRAVLLSYVPADAALFLYADVPAVWNSEPVKQFRATDKATFAKIDDAVKTFGSTVPDLKHLAVFVPQLKGPGDDNKFGVALAFAKPYDAKKLEAGFKEMAGKRAEVKLLTPSDTVAVALVGLKAEYAKPQPAAGPLADAIKSASTGTHALVAGLTFANLPDELQREDLPSQMRMFRPILTAESLTATLTIGKELELNARVRTKREAQAADAQKALAAFAKMVGDEAARELPDFEKAAEKDAELKPVVTVFKAGLKALGGAKFDVKGTEATARVVLPLDNLPVAAAYTAAVKRAQTAAASAQSTNNLKQIGLAMHNYHDANGNMPPAAVCDKKGKPQLSWRVLILPYIEEEALYKKFKLDEPWDSENNKKLLDQMPKVYAIPGQKAGANETHYRVFAGNGAAFEWVKGVRLIDYFDGTSNTIMVATAATAVPWTKPDELDFDPDADPTKLIGLVVNGRWQFVMGDGSVRSLNKIPPKDVMKALVTRAGGEVINFDF